MRMKIASLNIGNWSVWGWVLLASLLAAGCKSGGERAPAPVAEMSGAGASALTDDTYRGVDIISPGDELSITISDLPTLTPPIEERVREDGTITLLQNQTFTAKGKTFGDLGKEIRERYVPKFYRTMTVTVKPRESSRWYYVGGEVKVPARQVYLSRVTVIKAIQSCGWFTDFANKRKVSLIRANGNKYMIDCIKALKNPKLDLEVYPGDTINVPRRLM